MNRYTPAEKMEIIKVVEDSELPVKQTLQELDVPRSTFYRWYKAYLAQGYDGLTNQQPHRKQFWNQIPGSVRERVVKLALEHTEKSPRQLAWHITDTDGYFISESSVYRILKSFDLITSPVFQLVTAKDAFDNPTHRVNEMWQTDFTQFKVIDWGYYYLCTILDDYSRFILAWRLAPTMNNTDVQDTLTQAIQLTGIDQVKVRHRPRLLSDNGPAFVSDPLAKYLKKHQMKHIRGAPYHPQTQGKIERYHRSMKSIVKLDNYYIPTTLEHAIRDFVQYYNFERYHEALDNLTPAQVFHGRSRQVLSERYWTKVQTLQQRRLDYWQRTSHVR
jgi:putative transposase